MIHDRHPLLHDSRQLLPGSTRLGMTARESCYKKDLLLSFCQGLRFLALPLCSWCYFVGLTVLRRTFILAVPLPFSPSLTCFPFTLFPISLPHTPTYWSSWRLLSFPFPSFSKHPLGGVAFTSFPHCLLFICFFLFSTQGQVPHPYQKCLRKKPARHRMPV